MIWNILTELSNNIIQLFDQHYDKIDHSINPLFPNSKDYIWSSNKIRKAHMQITDHRSTSKILMMHINIFPNVNCNTPILGLDIIAGENKITGAFFDYSPVGEKTDMEKHFSNVVSGTDWKKTREMPEWAANIFSDNILAVSNIKDQKEVDQFYDIVSSLTEYYVEECEKTQLDSSQNFTHVHNTYCRMQKQNPALHRSIDNAKVPHDKKIYYLDNVLFEEI